MTLGAGVDSSTRSCKVVVRVALLWNDTAVRERYAEVRELTATRI